MTGPEPETGSTLPLSDAEEVDRLCDEFVAAHRNGEQPRIEDYLARAPEGAENQLLRDLIAEELDLQRKAGVTPDIEDYRQRFPERHAVIDAAWEMAGSIGGG